MHLYPTGKPSLPQDGKPDLLTSLQHEHGEQKPQSLQSSSSLRKNVTHTYLKKHWGGQVRKGKGVRRAHRESREVAGARSAGTVAKGP